MKKLFTLFISFLICIAMLRAQSPQKMSYQAVVRDAAGKLVVNQGVGIRISILQGSATGTEVFKEIYNPNYQTNTNGLVTLEIGSGLSLTGTFAGINWANGPYFIKTEIDPTGGTNYTVVGTSQLLSVPFALYAKTADSISGGIVETDPLFRSSVAKTIKASDTTRWGKKLSNYTETDPLFSASVAKGIKTSDTAKWNAASKTHYIGESYGGGIIFCVYEGGQHGLIAANSDQGTLAWTAGSLTNTMALANGVNGGMANTTIIIASQGYGNGTNYAANACNSYYLGVDNIIYGGWYLPSLYELYLLKFQRHIVGGFVEGGFYWSSTEADSNNAYYQQFSDNGSQGPKGKNLMLNVRAIRSF
jgi:hypothetical protein